MADKAKNGVSINSYEAALACCTRIESAINSLKKKHSTVDGYLKEIKEADWLGLASDGFFKDYKDYNDSAYKSALSKISSIMESIKGYIKVDEDINEYANKIVQKENLSQDKITSFVGETYGYTVAEGFVNYSVTKADLSAYDTITLSTGKQIPVYSSSKTNALYTICSNLSKQEKSELNSSLKGVLKNNQMAIVTYNNDYYNYNISNKNACTSNYAMVAKTNVGKMFSFNAGANTEIVVDDGSRNDTLMTSYNGMVLGNKMNMVMETGTVIPLVVDVKSNIEGGQKVIEFTRLSFSGGTNASVGNNYARVDLGEGWQQYANTKENRANGTWINEHQTKNVVTVGDVNEPSKGYREVGHVESTSIPVIITAGNVAGNQTMQGTVLYHHIGNRPGFESKDMLFFSQNVVNNW